MSNERLFLDTAFIQALPLTSGNLRLAAIKY